MADVQKPSTVTGALGNASVTIVGSGQVPPPLVVGPEEDDSELPTYFRMRNRYVMRDAILAGPIMDVPTAPVGHEFIRVGVPRSAMTCEWQSWRKGKRAQKPRPYLPDTNCIMLRNEIDMDNAELEGDDRGYFICSGTIYYAFRIRKQMTIAHPLPTYLFGEKAFQDKSVLVATDSDFVPKILDTAWVNPASANAVTKP